MNEKQRWVVGVRDSPKPPPQRVTFTLPVLNAAKNVIYAAVGASKAEMVKVILIRIN